MKNNIKVVNSPIVKQVEDTMKFYERELTKLVAKFVDAIFRGNFSGFAEEFSQAITEWFSQFLNWVETLAY